MEGKEVYQAKLWNAFSALKLNNEANNIKAWESVWIDIEFQPKTLEINMNWSSVSYRLTSDVWKFDTKGNKPNYNG
jgi:hypothetical protein